MSRTLERPFQHPWCELSLRHTARTLARLSLAQTKETRAAMTLVDKIACPKPMDRPVAVSVERFEAR